MEKTIMIDGKAVGFRSTAALPRLYRIRFGRDIFADLTKMQNAVKKEQERQKKEKDNASQLPAEAIYTFENIAYCMSKLADPAGVPENAEEWLDGFETFSIYEIVPEIMELWANNNAQLATPAKK